MGTFTFKWPHAAEEVYVTGTFDGWSKSEKLEKVGDHFEKTVTIPATSSEPIFYKFVVDGNWVTDHEAPIAKDSEGNDNNLLKLEDIVTEPPPMAAVINTVAPESSTVGLASNVPLEKKEADSVPGTFPETPAADQDKQFSVNPLPATEGAVNPVKLEAGEEVPKSIASNGIHNHVTLDKESYEKSDRIPGVVGPDDLAPVTAGSIIPESSLPITASEVVTNSAAPDSSTAALAADVPLEKPKAEATETTKSVAEHVAEGATAAGVALFAAGAAAKDAILGATQSEIAQSTAQQVTDTATSAKDTVVESTQSAVEATKATAADAAAQLPDSVKEVLPAAVQEAIPSPPTKEETIEKISPEVPSEVRESIAESGQGPEATTSTEAVEQKTAVEAQLLQEVKPAESFADQPKTAGNVPEEVKESIAEAGRAPEAASSSSAVDQKTAVESELLKEVETTKPIDEQPKTTEEPQAAEPAPAAAEAKTEVPTEFPTAVTNGAGEAAAAPAEAPSTPTKAAAAPSAATPASSSKAADSPATAERKKKNRLSSFFGKLKEKVSHKDKP